MQLLTPKEARWHFQISAGERNGIRFATGLSILARERPRKTVERLLLDLYLVSCPCHGYSWLLQVKPSKMAETINTGLRGEDPDGQVPRSSESGKETDLWGRNIYYPWFPSHVFCSEDSLYVWCTFSWSSPKTKQQNKYLLSCFLKHKEASKGKF